MLQFLTIGRTGGGGLAGERGGPDTAMTTHPPLSPVRLFPYRVEFFEFLAHQAIFPDADNVSDISDISARYRVIYVGNSQINW
jgi:hypothetical protein